MDYTERKRKVQQEIDLADTMKIPTMRYISIENGIIMLLKSLLSHTDRRNEGKSRNILAAIEKEDEIFLGDKGRKYEIRFSKRQEERERERGICRYTTNTLYGKRLTRLVSLSLA